MRLSTESFEGVLTGRAAVGYKGHVAGIGGNGVTAVSRTFTMKSFPTSSDMRVYLPAFWLCGRPATVILSLGVGFLFGGIE